jgi:hypothetical protein
MDVGKLRRQFCSYKRTQIQYSNGFFAGIFPRELLTFFRSIFFRGARFFPRPSFFVAGFFRGLFLGGGARACVRACVCVGVCACARVYSMAGEKSSDSQKPGQIFINDHSCIFTVSSIYNVQRVGLYSFRSFNSNNGGSNVTACSRVHYSTLP